MIIYNVTLSINPNIEEEVLDWLKSTHIPAVMETGLFLNNAIYKIVENPIERKHNSYAIQYKLDSWDKFDYYFKNYAPKLQAITKTKYGENVLAFRTFLEEI